MSHLGPIWPTLGPNLTVDIWPTCWVHLETFLWSPSCWRRNHSRSEWRLSPYTDTSGSPVWTPGTKSKSCRHGDSHKTPRSLPPHKFSPEQIWSHPHQILKCCSADYLFICIFRLLLLLHYIKITNSDLKHYFFLNQISFHIL